MKVRMMFNEGCKVHLGFINWIRDDGSVFGFCGWSSGYFRSCVRVESVDLLNVFPRGKYCQTCLRYLDNMGGRMKCVLCREELNGLLTTTVVATSASKAGSVDTYYFHDKCYTKIKSEQHFLLMRVGTLERQVKQLQDAYDLWHDKAKAAERRCKELERYADINRNETGVKVKKQPTPTEISDRLFEEGVKPTGSSDWLGHEHFKKPPWED